MLVCFALFWLLWTMNSDMFMFFDYSYMFNNIVCVFHLCWLLQMMNSDIFNIILFVCSAFFGCVELCIQIKLIVGWHFPSIYVVKTILLHVLPSNLFKPPFILCAPLHFKILLWMNSQQSCNSLKMLGRVGTKLFKIQF